MFSSRSLCSFLVSILVSSVILFFSSSYPYDSEYKSDADSEYEHECVPVLLYERYHVSSEYTGVVPEPVLAVVAFSITGVDSPPVHCIAVVGW